MRGIYDGYQTIETVGRETYFIGGNSHKGFVSNFDDIASEDKLDRVYIIKGGPGTGKSTFMREISKTAEENGIDTEYYLCGSDARSLDCVVLGGRIAVLDGTKPHIREMKYPGVKGELVDLSSFWDGETLELNKESVIYNSALKEAEYSSAGRYLKAAYCVETEMTELSKTILDIDKASGFVDRLIRKLSGPKGKSGKVHFRYTHGITVDGAKAVNTIPKKGHDVYYVVDTCGSASHFMEMLKNKLLYAGYHITVGLISYNECISGIFIHDCGVSVCVSSDCGNNKKINMSRFMRETSESDSKGRIRLAAKVREACIKEATSALNRASEFHYSLEDIYKASMNFERLAERRMIIESDIISRLK